MEIIPLWGDDKSVGKCSEENNYPPSLVRFPLKNCVEPKGAVLVFPGGSYRHLAKGTSEPIAEKFQKLGFQAFLVRYRCAPNRFPTPQLDAFRAIRMVRAHAPEWKVNPMQIASVGFSAGGHLAASTGTLYDQVNADIGDEYDGIRQRPDALVLGYSVINLTERIAHRLSGECLLGAKLDDPESERLDLEKRVDSNTPPAFVWHTADDAVVPAANSIRFAQAMWQAGNTCDLHIFPHGPHGVNLALHNPDIQVWPEMAAKFLTLHCGFDVQDQRS